MLNDDLETVEANAAARVMLGFPEMGSLEMEFVAGFWHVSRTAVLRMLEAARRGIAATAVTVRTVLDQLVEVQAFSLGATGWIGVVIVDRSGVDDAEHRLHAQEERYRSLFEWSPVALREEDFSAVGAWLDSLRTGGVVDLAEYLDANPGEVERAIMSIRTTRVNAAVVELLKAPSALAVMRGFQRDELSSQVLASFKSQFLAIWDGSVEHEADFVGVNSRGQPFERRLIWNIPRTREGRDLSRVVVAILDFTRYRVAERRLRRLVADKDRFVASVSHELRTPLSAVLGLSEELAINWKRFDAAEARELIELIAAQSNDLSLLVEDLLVAANHDNGRIAINPTIVELNSLARSALSDCGRSEARAVGIEPSGPVTVAFADEVRVRQILRNLVTNAFRYGGERVEVVVGSVPGPHVRVVDDGKGIPREHRDSIFDAYFQTDGTQPVLGSLGLGLAISRELARRMAGDLSYEFEDGWSIFTLDLPAV